MPRYEVKVQRTVTQEAWIYVDAYDEDDASARAKAEARIPGNDIDWTPSTVATEVECFEVEEIGR